MVGAGRGAGLGEPLLAFAAVIALAVALLGAARGVPFLQQGVQAAIACSFLFTPQLAARLSGRAFDPRAAGFVFAPSRGDLRALALALFATWPVFLAGFFVYYQAACLPDHFLPSLAHRLTPICSSWRGVRAGNFRLPDHLVTLALSEVLVVAIPEEVFFRGYLFTRLEERWPSRRRFLGAKVGKALLVTSALFALGHFLVDAAPARLAVFFPALVFGWMRSRTGSVAPGAIFHALCNLLSEALHESFF
ncbi:MAG: CPBP family intramembrane glutamic endopeptidase [Polyangia bacterium]